MAEGRRVYRAGWYTGRLYALEVDRNPELVRFSDFCTGSRRGKPTRASPVDATDANRPIDCYFLYHLFCPSSPLVPLPRGNYIDELTPESEVPVPILQQREHPPNVRLG